MFGADHQVRLSREGHGSALLVGPLPDELRELANWVERALEAVA